MTQQNPNPQVDAEHVPARSKRAKRSHEFAIECRRRPWRSVMELDENAPLGPWVRWRGKYRDAKSRDDALENLQRKYGHIHYEFRAAP